MSLISYQVGPFQKITVNSITVNNIRTNGCTIREEVPSQYFPCLNNSAMVDWHRIRFTLTFYNPNEFIINLGRGQVPNTSLNSPPDQQIYSLVLTSPSETYTFPTIRTEKQVEINYEKGRATQISIAFIAENRNVDIPLIQYNPS